MSAEEPSKSDPGATRKKKLSIKWLMTYILLIALCFGVLANRIRSDLRTRTARDHFIRWTPRLTEANPSLAMDRLNMEMGGDLLGSWVHHEGNFKTSTGRPIAIDFIFRDGLFDHLGQVVLSADGRSMTVPYEDIENGRTIDLKAEFPEAFR